MPQHHLPAQARPGWRLAPLTGVTRGLVDHRLAVPLPRSRALVTATTLADAGFAVAARVAVLAAATAAAAVVEVPVALAAGTAPTALRAALPAAAMAALPAAAAHAPLAVVPPTGDSVLLSLLLLPCALAHPFSSSPRRSGARWAMASVSQ